MRRCLPVLGLLVACSASPEPAPPSKSSRFEKRYPSILGLGRTPRVPKTELIYEGLERTLAGDKATALALWKRALRSLPEQAQSFDKDGTAIVFLPHFGQHSSIPPIDVLERIYGLDASGPSTLETTGLRMSVLVTSASEAQALIQRWQVLDALNSQMASGRVELFHCPSDQIPAKLARVFAEESVSARLLSQDELTALDDLRGKNRNRFLINLAPRNDSFGAEANGALYTERYSFIIDSELGIHFLSKTEQLISIDLKTQVSKKGKGTLNALYHSEPGSKLSRRVERETHLRLTFERASPNAARQRTVPLGELVIPGGETFRLALVLSFSETDVSER